MGFRARAGASRRPKRCQRARLRELALKGAGALNTTENKNRQLQLTSRNCRRERARKGQRQRQSERGKRLGTRGQHSPPLVSKAAGEDEAEELRTPTISCSSLTAAQSNDSGERW